MWFRRDLRLGDHPALPPRWPTADEVVPLFVVDPALWAPAGTCAAPTSDALAVAGRRDGRTCSTSAPATPSSRCQRWPPSCGRRRGPCQRRLRAVRAPRDEPSSRHSPTPGSRWSGPARRTRCPRDAYASRTTRRTASTRRSTARGPSTAGDARHGSAALACAAVAGADDGLPAARPRRPRAPPGRRGGGRRRWRARSSTDDRRLPRRARPPRPRRHVAPLDHLALGRDRTRAPCSPTSAAPAARAETFRKELAWREFYADVLFHEPGAGAYLLRRSWRCAWTTTGPGERVRGVARGPHRLPVRRRGHAPAARRGVDAQPDPHGRRVVPRARTCTSTGARRPVVHAAPASTATSHRTTTAGSGSRGRGRTRRRTSGSSTR